MFRSSKKLEDPPKAMSVQENQEDLETFAKSKKIINKQMIIEDIKTRQEDLTLPEWWDAFEVNQLQIERMQQIKQQLIETKYEVNQHKIQLAEHKENLEQGIGDTLKRLQQMKTP